MQTLTAWITANPEYNKYPGTVSGKPWICQVATGNPSLTADDWYVFDMSDTFPDLSQSPATVDITTTGSIARRLIPTVPDAPSPTDAQVFLGQDTDQGIEDIEELIALNETATDGKKFYMGNFLGIGKKSEIYAASVSWTSGIGGSVTEALVTNISITPNLGVYHKREVITAGA